MYIYVNIYTYMNIYIYLHIYEDEKEHVITAGLYFGHHAFICVIKTNSLCNIFFDGYCSTVQGLLDWVEVDLGFTKLSFVM